METTRDLPLFPLIDACERGGCPICSALEEDEAHYFRSLLYEHVNNRYFRAGFNRSGGFCGAHADALLQQRDRLAVVLLHRQILRERSGGGQARPAGDCPACEYLRGREEQLKSVLWKYRNDEALIEALQASGGLCLPHYRKIREEHLRLPRWFVDYHHRQYAQLTAAADSYVDASNFTTEGSLGDPGIRGLQVDRRLIDTLYGFRRRPPERARCLKRAGNRSSPGAGRRLARCLIRVLRRLGPG